MKGQLKKSLCFNQASLGDMLMFVWRWTGRRVRAVGQRKGTDPWPGGMLQVSPSGPPGWPTGRCSYSGQDPAGSTWPAPPCTGTKRCLETSRGSGNRGAGSNGEIISVRFLQLKRKVWRRGMSTKKVWWNYLSLSSQNGRKWILKMQ